MNRQKSRYTRVVAIVLSLCLCFPIQTYATEAEIKKQQKETQKQLDEINKQVKSIEGQRNQVLNEIDALDSELIDLVLNLELLAADLEAKQAELNQAEIDYQAAKKREEEQYEDMKLRIQYIYEEGNQDYLTLLLTAESFSDFLNKKDFSQEIHEQDRSLLIAYQETKQEVIELLDQLEQEKADLMDLQDEYETEKANVEAALAQKQAQEANFESQLADARSKAQAYKNKLNEQAAELKRLEKERKRREAEAAAAAAAAAKNNSSSESGTISNSNTITNPGNTSNSDPGESSSGGGTVSSGGNNATGSAIANYALQFVGNPYVAGGTSLTNGADCSGFTQSVYRNFGISIPRSSSAQRSAGREVSYSEAQAGDLICYSGHVAIYLGGGRIVHASTPASGIKTGNAQYRPILSVRRCY